MINAFRKLKTIEKIALIYSLIPMFYCAVCMICLKISGGDYYWSPHLSSKALEIVALILVTLQCGLLLFVSNRVGLFVSISLFINTLCYAQLFLPIVFAVLLLILVIALALIFCGKRKSRFIGVVILPILLLLPIVFTDVVIVNFGKLVTSHTVETYASADGDYVIEEITKWHFDEPCAKEVLIRENQTFNLIFISIYGKTEAVDLDTHSQRFEDKDFTVEWISNEEFRICDVVYKVSEFFGE